MKLKQVISFALALLMIVGFSSATRMFGPLSMSGSTHAHLQKLPADTRLGTIDNTVDIPIWSQGSWWRYNIPLSLSGDMNGTEINININEVVTYTVDGITTYDINGTNYDTYHLTTSGDFTGTLLFDSYNVALNGDVYGQRFVDRSDLSMVRDETTLDGTMSMMGGLITSNFKLVTNNTYTTPLEFYDFPINVGEMWHVSSHIDTDGYFWFAGLDLSMIDPSYKINETKQDISDTRDIDTTANCNDSYRAILGSDAVNVYEIDQGQDNGYLNIWYSPEVASYYKMHIDGTESSNFSFSGMDITLDDFGLKSEDMAVSVELNPSTAGAGETVYVTGTAEPGSSIDVYIPVAGTHVSGTADDTGAFNFTVTAPALQDNTSTSYDIGSHGVLVHAVGTSTSGWAAATLTVIAPDLSVYPSDIVLDPEVPVENSTVGLSVTVHNNDVADIANVSASVFVDDNMVDTINTSMIGRGDNWTFQSTWDTEGYKYGRHTIKVKVGTTAIDEINKDNNVAEKRVSINRRPFAFATASPSSIYFGQYVFFNASSSTDPDGWITNYFFDFGDGTNSSWTDTPTIGHTYTTKGDLTASVIVRDNRGTESLPYNITVDVRNIPPTANISAGPGWTQGTFITEYNVVVFHGGDSTDPDGNVTVYFFDFGDGNNSGWQSSPEAKHTYTMAGNYTVVLKVKDDSGDEGEANMTVSITNQPPVVNIVTTMNTVETYETLTVNVTAKDTDSIMTLTVDFGDGTVNSTSNSISGTFTHQYIRPGVYNLTVTAMDSKFALGAAIKNITVLNRAPDVGEITISPEVIHRNTPVTFSVGSVVDKDGNVSSMYWTLPDNSRVNGTTANYTFTVLGTFQVEFTAVDDMGKSVDVPVTLNVVNIPPTVAITSNITSTTVGVPITLTTLASDSDGKITNITWNMGDGTSIYGSNATHTWMKVGTFNVTVTAVDNDGGISHAYWKVTVKNASNGGSSSPKTEKSSNMLYIAILILVIIVLAVVGIFALKPGDTEGKEEQKEVSKAPAEKKEAPAGHKSQKNGRRKTPKAKEPEEVEIEEEEEQELEWVADEEE